MSRVRREAARDSESEESGDDSESRGLRTNRVLQETARSPKLTLNRLPAAPLRKLFLISRDLVVLAPSHRLLRPDKNACIERIQVSGDLVRLCALFATRRHPASFDQCLGI